MFFGRLIRGTTIRRIFVFAIVLSFVIWAFLLIQNPEGLQRSAFLEDGHDWFMDYFNTVYYSVGKTPYTWGWLPARNYLPICYMMLYPASFLYPYNVENLDTAYAARNSQLPAIGMAFYLIISMWFIYYPLKKQNMRGGIFLGFLCSGVMLFNLDRANQIMIAAGLVWIYYILIDDRSRIRRHLGYVCLALAAVMKIYPALFGALLLHRKRYKDVAFVIIYAILLAFLPFFWLNGGFWENIQAYLAALKEHSKAYAGGAFGFSANMMFFNGISIPVIFSNLYGLVAVLFAGSHRKAWKCMLLITYAFIMMSGQQGIYCYIFMFLPILLFLNEEYHTISDLLYLFGFILILLPIRYLDLNLLIDNQRMMNTVSIIEYVCLTVEAMVCYVQDRKKSSHS